MAGGFNSCSYGDAWSAQVGRFLCFNLAPQLLHWDTLGRQLRLFQSLRDLIPERSGECPD
jgi:hypothetical protein